MKVLKYLEPRWAYALTQLPYRTIFYLNEFSDISGTSLNRSRLALRQYQEAGFCKSLGKGKWIKTHQPRPIINSICAIETKLSNWKRALFQAFRYYDFCK